MRGSALYSVLSKQGGSNTKKWADRHFILNDTFLFYYAAKGDKEPKGIIRLDLAKVIFFFLFSFFIFHNPFSHLLILFFFFFLL